MEKLRAAFKAALDFLIVQLREEFDAQGHKLTGKLSKSLSYEIIESKNKLIGLVKAEDYALVLEFGVPASRIPYGGRGTKGRTSKYIQGLIRFFTLLGKTGRESVSAAFRTAKVQKREGSPTRGSYRYTRNTWRTDAISKTLAQSLPEFAKIMTDALGTYIELEIAGTFERPKMVFEI